MKMPRAIGGFNPAVTFGEAYKSTMGVLREPEERQWELEKRGYEKTGLLAEEAISKEKMRLLEQDKKERETMVPVMNFAPQINQTPNLKNAWVNALKQAGHKYEEGEGGVAMVSTSGVNFIKKQMQTDLDFVDMTLKASKQDAQAQYNSIASEVSKFEQGGKPVKPELMQKMKAAANQIATITNSENFLKQQKGKDLAKRIKEQYRDQYQLFPEALKFSIDKLEETGDSKLYDTVIEEMSKQEFKTQAEAKLPTKASLLSGAHGEKLRQSYINGEINLAQAIEKAKQETTQKKETAKTKLDVDKMFAQYNVKRITVSGRKGLSDVLAKAFNVSLDPEQEWPKLTREQFETLVTKGELPIGVGKEGKRGTIRYKAGGNFYDIPLEDEEALATLKKKYPNAVKVGK
jgi:hypothetical protein